MQGYGKRLIALVVGLAALMVPSSAGAATQIGETFLPSTGCSDLQTQFQTSWPGPSYAAPSQGVITSWSFLAGATPPQLKLKVARHASGNDYTIVGESTLRGLTPSALNTIGTRIPVQAGDLIGFYNASFGQCGALSSGGPYEVHGKFEDVPLGTTTTFNPSGFRLDVSAMVEPDADNDGFGDETQDQCLTNASTQGPCPLPPDTSPPNTTIIKSPPNKTNKTQVKFKFTSSEAGSTFECKLDKKPYRPCTSPRILEVDKGKHRFKVRAIDPAGNVDPSAAKDKFKVL